MRCLRHTAFLVVSVLVATHSLRSADDSAPLRLVGTTLDGQEFDQIVTENGELRVHNADGSSRPVPRGTRWWFDGELGAHGPAIFLSPDYDILTRPIRPFPGKKAVCEFGIVRLWRDWPWSDRELRGSIVVVAWMLNRRVVHVVPVPALLRSGPSGELAAVVAIELEKDEARGFPLIVLCSQGRLVPPKVWFHDAHMQRAFVTMYTGSGEQFEAALEDIRKIDVLSERGKRTLLHFAASDGLHAPLRQLLNRSAKSDLLDVRRATPLHRAAAHGRETAIAMLLESSAKNGLLDSERYSAFDRAVASGNLIAARALMRQNQRLDELENALEVSIWYADEPMVEFLLGRGTGSHVRKIPVERFATVLESGNTTLVSRLLGEGMNADRSPQLLWAVASRKVEIVDALLTAGAQPDRAGYGGSTALMLAAWNGDLLIAESLLRAGAAVNKTNDHDESAIFLARSGRRYPVVALLESAGATTPSDPEREKVRKTRPTQPGDYFRNVENPPLEETMVDLPPRLKSGVAPEWLQTVVFDGTRVAQASSDVSFNPDAPGGEYYGDSSVRMFAHDGVGSPAPNHWAVASVIVESDGIPSEWSVIDSSWKVFGDGLDSALKRYRFWPGEKDGKPVRTRTTLVVTVE